MLTRRNFVLASLAAPLAGSASSLHAQDETLPIGRSGPESTPAPSLTAQSAPGKMLLAIHQNTSRSAGFRGSLEGWSRAGIQYVELNDRLLDGFLENDTLAGARSLLGDLGLTPVCGAAGLQDIWIPGPAREGSLETWRRRCEQYASLGLERIYSPSLTNRRVTAEDFAATPDCIREAGQIASEYNLTAMIEFLRTSTHLATLTSALAMIREAAQPNVRPMIDFFHFWSGLSKFDDLDLLEPGELAHCHFQDLLDGPRELIDNNSRLIPGDGIAPVVRILQKLGEKGYDGALSVELFRPEFVRGDPFQVATEIRRKCEAVMREAQVL